MGENVSFAKHFPRKYFSIVFKCGLLDSMYQNTELTLRNTVEVCRLNRLDSIFRFRNVRSEYFPDLF